MTALLVIAGVVVVLVALAWWMFASAPHDPPWAEWEDEERLARLRASIAASAPAFRTLVLDVDSTLCGLEGVDWLARLRGDDVARQSAELTDQAMSGAFPIETVYGKRLEVIQPTREEVEALAREYRARLAHGAAEVIRAVRAAGVRVILVSGGFVQAILPVARELGFSDSDVFAVNLNFDDEGRYAGFDADFPTARQNGKLEIVRSLSLPRPVLAVGDGSTDLAMRPAVDAFAAFTGFERRDAVVAAADYVIDGFADLESLLFT
jgi:phosphoserine phosphatase